MILGLSYASDYFQYLTIAAIFCFLTSVITNKLSFIFFMSQNEAHPLLDAQGFQSPRVKFTSVVVFTELLSYILAFTLIRYQFFMWLLLAYYIYPIVHVYSAVKRGNKNNFRW